MTKPFARDVAAVVTFTWASEAISVALLVNPGSPVATLQIAQLQEAARAAGVQLHTLKAAREDEFGAAFAELLPRRADAMVVAADPFFNDRRHQLVAFAAHHAIPTIYEWREFVDAGGLVSYGVNLEDTYRRRPLRRPDPQGREARRPADRAADQI